MSVRLFGTDGMRGRVNKYPMTPEVALRLGLAAGTFYRDKNRRSRVVIGKDTRLSGYVFENALAAGLLAAGMDVFLVGPLPTPAISFLTTNMRADVGVVISASHNPFSDNGIKFFDAEGFKIPDADEDRMTEMVLDPNFDWNYPEPANTGRAYKIKDAPGRYIVYLKNSFPAHLSLEGLRVVIDCANGANYRVAPLALEELGAEVVKIGTEPNGLNTAAVPCTPRLWPRRSARRGPILGLLWTAMPIASSSWTKRAPFWMATRSWPCALRISCSKASFQATSLWPRS